MCPTIQSMEDFKERLLLFIQAKEMSVRRFEETCGITNGTIGSIKAQGPTASVVSKIADTFPELNLNWLFRGDGTMLCQENPVAKTTQNDIHDNQVVIANWADLKEVLIDVLKNQGR